MTKSIPFDPTRRSVLKGAAALAGAAIVTPSVLALPASADDFSVPTPFGTVFALGVASGEPRSTSVMIWTRLAPNPVADPIGGGMPIKRYPAVQFQVARDSGFANLVASGEVRTGLDVGFSVRNRVYGLEPNTEYWYRFRFGNDLSPIGRTKTAPKWGASPDELRFAALSCANYENGEFSAYARAAEEDLDFWVHLGDYIYEGDARASARRQHNPTGKREIETLAEYRARWSHYKLDPALQALHAAAPLLHVPDDHEVENNFAGLIDEDTQTPDVANFAEQRGNAYKAMWENLPYSWIQRPVGPDIRTPRNARFGERINMAMLDTRQFRTDQLELLGMEIVLAPTTNPDGTLLGDEQEDWVVEQVQGKAQWNVLAQQVMMTRATLPVAADDPENPLGIDLKVANADAWDGYPEARARLLNRLAAQNTNNLVVLSGDIHCSFVSDLATDFDDLNTTMGTEFTVTGVTSSFPAGRVGMFEAAAYSGLNPNIHYVNAGKAEKVSSADEHHGYHLHTVAADTWRCDIRQVDNVDSPDAGVSTVASYVIEAGSPGAHPA